MDNLLNEKIRAVRRELNLTQENIAKELNISYQLYQKYERGERKINDDTLAKIAEAMNVSVEYIQEKELGGVNITNNNCSGNVGFYGDNISNDIDEIMKLVKEMNENNLKYMEKIIMKLYEKKD